MAQKTRPHKYRVSIYLGKELYETLGVLADEIGIPLASLCRVLLQTGKEFADTIEKGAKKI